VVKPRAIALACVLLVAALGAGPGHARTIGQVIDDAALNAAVRTKLSADHLWNLVRIDVGSNEGVVTLSGTVDTAERRDRIEQIARGVEGVKRVVNNVQVRGDDATSSTEQTPPASGSVPGARVDATGTVASVEPASGTLALADGRIVRVTDGTTVWQASTVEALRPGSQVLIRDGRLEERAASRLADVRMGTVQSVDRAAGRLVLTDGTIVRVSPSTIVQRRTERLTLDALQPGWEIVVRGPRAPAVDATQIDVVWAPTARTR
jgi:hyperosmotically inducible protein